LPVCITKERTPPSNKKKKTRTNNDHRRANSANQSKNEIERTPWEEGFNVQGSVEGPISPVNYAGTQINIWGTPGGNWTDELMHIADPSRNPNYGYMTEQMLEVSFCRKRNIYPFVFITISLLAFTTIEKFTNCSTTTTANNRYYSRGRFLGSETQTI